MRYLRERNEDGLLNTKGQGTVNQDDIDKINERIDSVEAALSLDSEALEKYKRENSTAITTGKLATNAVLSDSIKSNTITSDELTSNKINGKLIKSDVGEIDVVISDKVNASEIKADDLNTENVTATNATVNTASIDEATIGKLTVTGDVEYSGTTTYDYINANIATINNATINEVRSELTDTLKLKANEIESNEATIESITGNEAKLRTILNEQIYHRFYKVTLSSPTEDDYNIIELPYFAEGYYALSLRDENDAEIFSLYVTNTASNMTFAYSRARFVTGEPATLYDFKVKEVHSRPQLYCRTQQGGTLYYYYQGLDKLEDVSPNTYSEWPFDVSEEGTLSYIAYHRAATVFTHHLDYGDNTLPPGVTGTLFLVPSENFEERTMEDTEFDTKSDVAFHVYVPDQSLNTDDEVQFKSITVTETTNLNGNVTVQNNTDPANPTKVESVDVYTENWYESTDSKTVEVDSESLTYNNLILIGHNQSEDDYHLHIYDNVEIGEPSDPMTPTPTGDRHNLTVHGEIIGDLNVGGEEGNALRIRQDENGLHIAPEPTARTNSSNAIVAEDRVVTADKLATYNGIANPRAEDDELYDTNDDYYPIEHLNDGTQVHGNLNVDHTTDTKVLHAERADINDLYVTENAIFDKTVGIRGDLVVDGSIIATDEKTVETSSDYVVLRQNQPTGLSATEQSGLVVHNYDGNGSTATIAADNQGTFRVSDTASEHTDTFSNLTYYNGTYTDTSGATVTIPKGITTALDEDTLDDTVLYNGDYYHFNGEYFLVTIDNKLTYDENSPVTNTDVISALDALDRYPLTYYRSLSITTIDATQNQPILTRAEESDLVDKVPLMWDSENKKAISIINEAPEKRKLSIVSDFDQDGNLFYKWGKSGGGSGTVLRLTQDELDARLLITNPDDDDFIPDGSLIVITDDAQDYVEGEEIND